MVYSVTNQKFSHSKKMFQNHLILTIGIYIHKFLESAVGVEFVRAWDIFNALVIICWQMFRVFLPFLIIATVLVGGGLGLTLLVFWICSPRVVPDESVDREPMTERGDRNLGKELILSQVACGLRHTEKQLIETLTVGAREKMGWSPKSHNDVTFIAMVEQVIRTSIHTCTTSICTVVENCYNPHTPMTNLVANARNGPLAWKWCIPIGIVWVMYLTTDTSPYHRYPSLFEILALTGISSLLIRGVSWIVFTK